MNYTDSLYDAKYRYKENNEIQQEKKEKNYTNYSTLYLIYILVTLYLKQLR